MTSSIVLVSTSPQRKKLLSQLVSVFTITKPALTKESFKKGHTFEEQVAELAWRKAQSVQSLFPNALLISADTIIVHQGEQFGKAENLQNAAAMLKRFSGEAHDVMTGVCLLHTGRGQMLTFTETTRVYFKKNDEQMISSYLSTGEWEGRAGSYAIQEKGVLLTEKIVGSYTNVVGLPLETLGDRLIDWGVPIYDAAIS